MKNPPFNSLVWGSLRLAPITSSVSTYQYYKCGHCYCQMLTVLRHGTFLLACYKLW